jgi:hypothetical protein
MASPVLFDLPIANFRLPIGFVSRGHEAALPFFNSAIGNRNLAIFNLSGITVAM